LAFFILGSSFSMSDSGDGSLALRFVPLTLGASAGLAALVALVALVVALVVAAAVFVAVFAAV
jgi:hypothetical protein